MKTLSSQVVRLVFVPMALCFGVSVAHAADPYERPEFSALPREHQVLLSNWLVQDCRVGAEAEEMQAVMISVGPRLELALWEAFELGPTEAERIDLQNALGDRYALRQRWLLKTPDALGDFGAQVLAESEEEFRLNEDLKLYDRWRDASLGGLGLVCTERSVGRLREIAEDRKNPASLAAEVALRTSDQCRGR